MSNNQSIFNKIYTIYQIKCFTSDGNEIKIKQLKKILLEKNEYSRLEINIFGISNRLYKEILTLLNEMNIKYTIYERSLIKLKAQV